MNLGVPELVIIFLIILVVFGAGKIPAIARAAPCAPDTAVLMRSTAAQRSALFRS